MKLRIGISMRLKKTSYPWIIILKWYRTWKSIKLQIKHREDQIKITINKLNHLNQELKKMKKENNMHLIH